MKPPKERNPNIVAALKHLNNIYENVNSMLEMYGAINVARQNPCIGKLFNFDKAHEDLEYKATCVADNIGICRNEILGLEIDTATGGLK